MNYAFKHKGKVYTPASRAEDISDVEQHNATLERAELARWESQPDQQLAYFSFPAENLPLFSRPRPYRANFSPLLHSFVNRDMLADPGLANLAIVTTWRGAVLGTITAAKVYRHNLGGRFVSLTVEGSNGATYHGRASWDNGQCVMLRKAKV